jgi:CRP-like cAMP-binding protein
MIVAGLSEADLFQDLPPAVLEDLSGSCTPIERHAGDVILKPLDGTPPAVLLVVDGELEILQEDEVAGQIRLGQIRQGGLVGEFGAIDGVRGRCTVRATSAVRLISIPHGVFRQMVAQHPVVATRLLHDMISLIRRLNGGIASLQSAHVELERIRLDLIRYVV